MGAFYHVYFFSIFFEERTYKRFLKAHVPDSISSTFKVKYFIKKDFFCFYSASSLFIEYLIDGLLIFLAIKAHFSPYLIVSTLTGVKILGCLLQGYSATFYNPADQLSNWFVSLIIFVSGASYYFLSSSSLTIFISIVCFRAVFCNYKVLIRGIHATIGNAQMNWFFTKSNTCIFNYLKRATAQFLNWY